MRGASTRLALALLLAGLAGGCSTPDPQRELSLSGFEGYWVVDRPIGTTQRISPAVRFTLTNKSASYAIQAQAKFQRVGEDLEWGGAWAQVSPAGNPIPPGGSRVVVLVSDAHYTSPDPPETMLTNAAFKDARADVFVRVGPSGWTRMGSLTIERRIGTQALEDPAGEPAGR